MPLDFIQMNQLKEVLNFLSGWNEHEIGRVHYFDYSNMAFLSGSKCSSTVWKKITK